MLRNVEVTAYPTIGGMRGKQALIVSFMKPVFRGRISNNSIALQTVGVSNFARAIRYSGDNPGVGGMRFPGSRVRRGSPDPAERATEGLPPFWRPSVAQRGTDHRYARRCPRPATTGDAGWTGPNINAQSVRAKGRQTVPTYPGGALRMGSS